MPRGLASRRPPPARLARGGVTLLELLVALVLVGGMLALVAPTLRTPPTGLACGLRSAAALIKAEIGVEAVHLDIGGWDTHTDQNPLTGGMNNQMTQLSGALGSFWQDCISSGFAQNVTVVVLSEFGRNVRENGSRGTDHGRGTAMFAMGRGIRGGRVLTNNWRPLAQENLADKQDLAVSIDYRDILGEIVQNRLGNTKLSTVFPGYVPAFRGVTK